MRRLVLALLILSSTAFAGSITGVFQGTVVQITASQPQAKTRWMYVQGKNGIIRRANIAKANFDYDEEYPKAKRHKKPEESLKTAATVRVTAEQDITKGGDWQATKVSFVWPDDTTKPAPKSKAKPSAATPVLAKR